MAGLWKEKGWSMEWVVTRRRNYALVPSSMLVETMKLVNLWEERYSFAER